MSYAQNNGTILSFSATPLATCNRWKLCMASCQCFPRLRGSAVCWVDVGLIREMKRTTHLRNFMSSFFDVFFSTVFMSWFMSLWVWRCAHLIYMKRCKQTSGSIRIFRKRQYQTWEDEKYGRLKKRWSSINTFIFKSRCWWLDWMYTNIA